MRFHNDIKWLYPEQTLVKHAWFITISGFDASDPPAEASFIWPDDVPLTIPNKMVLMSKATFAELCREAGHGVGEPISDHQNAGVPNPKG